MTTEQLKDLRDAITCELEGKPWQWKDETGIWRDCSKFDSAANLFTTGYPARPKPTPKTRPWSTPADVPLNCWLRRAGKSGCSLVIGVGDSGVSDMIGNQISHETWGMFKNQEYSTDRITWHKCEVTEE